MVYLLSPAEVTRYSQQIALPEWGREAQQKVKSSRVLLAGAGGLGSVIALHLLAAGVGALRLVDRTRISLPDLNSTFLYRERDLGRIKSAIAERRLKELNPFGTIEGLGKAISEHNVNRLASGCHLLINAMPEEPAGDFLNLVAVKHCLPLLTAWVGEMDGQVTTFWPGKGPCLACYLPEAPVAGTSALMGPLPGILGGLLSLEALRILGGLGPALVGRLLIFQGRRFSFQEKFLKENPDCPVCRPRQTHG
jgi:adenylyltransferase/sulfurtransferase|uniref:HesA/MoeB/ThiF family protein n=1 Tax=Desulfobacca acetoxidans TaxID=60893 RepID=A0A7C3SHN6_9BACT